MSLRLRALLAAAVLPCLLALVAIPSNAQGPYAYNWGMVLAPPSNFDTPTQVGGTVINMFNDSLASIRPGSVAYSLQVNIPTSVTTTTIVFGSLRLNPSTGLYSVCGSYEFTVAGPGVQTFVVPPAARWQVLSTDNMATWYRPSATEVQKNFYPYQPTGAPVAALKQWILPFTSIPSVGNALPAPTSGALGRTLPLTYTILPPFDSYAPLNLVNPATMWPTGRTRYASMVPRGRLFMTGGLWPSGYLPDGGTFGDMCSSPDRGVGWQCTPKYGFPGRAGHYIANFLRPNTSQPALFVLGGYGWEWRPENPAVSPLYDAWFYDDSSATWVLAQQYLPFAARDGASLINCQTADHASMYIMGGWLFVDQVYDNQVWTSADGVLWTQVTVAAPFPARADAAVSVIAGGTATILAGGRTDSTVFSDVWISNSGLTEWTQVTATAPWGSRFGMSMVSHAGLLYAIGGSDASYVSYSDAWVSADEGRSWQCITQTGGQMAPRALAQAVMIGSQMIVMGGNTWETVSEAELNVAARNNVQYFDVRASPVAASSHEGANEKPTRTLRSHQAHKHRRAPSVMFVTKAAGRTFRWKPVDDTWDMYL